MGRYVALFRGINVGKAKRISMADLGALLGKLGYTDVRTLLNSGNAVFSGDDDAAPEHAARIRAAVAKKLGVDAHVVVKSERDIAAIIKGNAIGALATDPARLLIVFTDDPRGLAGLKALARADWNPEKIHVGKHAAYAWCANGILESKALETLLKSLGASGTTRNWTTLNRIHALMRDAAPATSGR
jgi:uncharacterized protein (DUF1697 family)